MVFKHRAISMEDSPSSCINSFTKVDHSSTMILTSFVVPAICSYDHSLVILCPKNKLVIAFLDLFMLISLFRYADFVHEYA
jgi:hypothetical protein